MDREERSSHCVRVTFVPGISIIGSVGFAGSDFVSSVLEGSRVRGAAGSASVGSDS